MSLVVRRVEDSRQSRTAYLVGCARSGEAVIFDPPRDIDHCMEVAAREGLRIAAVAETQSHCDVLSGARELAERTGAFVLASGAGGIACTPRWVDRYAHRLLRDGDTHEVGSIRIGAMHSPGFSPEQMIYLVYAHVDGMTVPIGAIAGNFLNTEYQCRSEHSSNSVAANRAARELAQVYRDSLKRFLALPEWMQVWPSHPVRTAALAGASMPQTTIGCERRHGRVGPLLDDVNALSLVLADSRRESVNAPSRIRATNLEGVPVLVRMPEPLVLGGLTERTDLIDPEISTVVDTRAWRVFRSGHLRGAIHAPLGRNFAATVASFIEPDERVVLVCDPTQTNDLVRECVRVGIDRVEGIVPPALLHPHRGHLQVEREMTASGAAQAMASGEARAIDVRDGDDCARGMIAGALRIPASRLRQRGEEFRGQRVVAYCATGAQSATAVSVLRRMGVDAVNLTGGFEGWKRAGQPVVAPGGFEVDPACQLGLAPAH